MDRDYPIKFCAICDKMYKPKSGNSKYCNSEPCFKEWRKRAMKSWKERNPNYQRDWVRKNKPPKTATALVQNDCTCCGSPYPVRRIEEGFVCVYCSRTSRVFFGTCTCGKIFASKYETKKFCSSRCSNKYHSDRGSAVVLAPSPENTRRLSPERFTNFAKGMNASWLVESPDVEEFNRRHRLAVDMGELFLATLFRIDNARRIGVATPSLQNMVKRHGFITIPRTIYKDWMGKLAKTRFHLCFHNLGCKWATEEVRTRVRSYRPSGANFDEEFHRRYRLAEDMGELFDATLQRLVYAKQMKHPKGWKPVLRKGVGRRHAVAQKRYRECFHTQFTTKLRSRLNTSLRFGTGGDRGFDWLGYSITDLKERLLETLPDGYSWEDCLNGKLHIDHIKPVARFPKTKAGLWASYRLGNLQLLPASENMSKGAKYDEQSVR